MLNSCSPVKGLKKTSYDKPLSTNNSVLSQHYNTALYKAGIAIFDNYYSGLFFIKNIQDKKMANIVFMSEFGLSFMDMKFENNAIQTNNVQEFLNRKAIISNMENFFLALFMDISEINNTDIFVDDTNAIKVIKFKQNSSRYYYFCNQDNKIERIIQKKRGRAKLEISLKYNNEELPSEIKFENKRIKLRMELELVRLN